MAWVLYYTGIVFCSYLVFYVNFINKIFLNFSSTYILTPLEAFKTDVYFFSSGYYYLYPSVNNYQINTQYLAALLLCIVLVYLILNLWYDLFLVHVFLRIYINLCLFYLDQLKFLMRNYFVSFIVILIVVSGFNIIGLIPYTGSFTAQLAVNLNFTLSIVFGLVLIGFNTQGIRFLLNFIPQNVPRVMVPFLFIIEILSFLMRIFSMSIRLFSNMVAGHSLLHLLHEFTYFLMKLGNGKSLFIIVSLIPLGISYFWLFFELFVAFLQAYVFVLLFLLYVSDVNKSH